MDIEPDRTVQDRLIQLEADTATLHKSMEIMVTLLEGIYADLARVIVSGSNNA